MEGVFIFFNVLIGIAFCAYIYQWYYSYVFYKNYRVNKDKNNRTTLILMVMYLVSQGVTLLCCPFVIYIDKCILPFKDPHHPLRNRTVICTYLPDNYMFSAIPSIVYPVSQNLCIIFLFIVMLRLYEAFGVAVGLHSRGMKYALIIAVLLFLANILTQIIIYGSKRSGVGVDVVARVKFAITVVSFSIVSAWHLVFSLRLIYRLELVEREIGFPMPAVTFISNSRFLRYLGVKLHYVYTKYFKRKDTQIDEGGEEGVVTHEVMDIESNGHRSQRERRENGVTPSQSTYRLHRLDSGFLLVGGLQDDSSDYSSNGDDEDDDNSRIESTTQLTQELNYSRNNKSNDNAVEQSIPVGITLLVNDIPVGPQHGANETRTDGVQLHEDIPFRSENMNVILSNTRFVNNSSSSNNNNEYVMSQQNDLADGYLSDSSVYQDTVDGADNNDDQSVYSRRISESRKATKSIGVSSLDTCAPIKSLDIHSISEESRFVSDEQGSMITIVEDGENSIQSYNYHSDDDTLMEDIESSIPDENVLPNDRRNVAIRRTVSVSIDAIRGTAYNRELKRMRSGVDTVSLPGEDRTNEYVSDSETDINLDFRTNSGRSLGSDLGQRISFNSSTNSKENRSGLVRCVSDHKIGRDALTEKGQDGSETSHLPISTSSSSLIAVNDIDYAEFYGDVPYPIRDNTTRDRKYWRLRIVSFRLYASIFLQVSLSIIFLTFNIIAIKRIRWRGRSACITETCLIFHALLGLHIIRLIASAIKIIKQPAITNNQ